MAVRKNKFSFEPQLAFSAKDAKPWYFVFWLRYKAIETSRFNMGVGFHPGFLFGPADFMANGSNEDYMATSRFFVGELTPNYMISKNVSVGALYQYSRGFNSQLRNSNFVGVNANFSDICLGNTFFMRAQPQVYYLKNDDLDGFYASTALTFAKRNFLFKI